jgi:hypothetical protein
MAARLPCTQPSDLEQWKKKFAGKNQVVVYNKKRFVLVVGLEREEQADCPLVATVVRDKNCDNKKNTLIELKKSIMSAAKITLMQEKSLALLSEAAIQKIEEVMQQKTCLVRAHQSSEQPLWQLKQQAP